MKVNKWLFRLMAVLAVSLVPLVLYAGVLSVFMSLVPKA